jgi:hypothetical protein
MDLRRLLGGEFAWDGNPPSAQGEIDQLVGWFPIAPPTEYLDLLRKSDGGTAIRSVYPTYARIWSAEMVPKNNEGYHTRCRTAFGLLGFIRCRPKCRFT